MARVCESREETLAIIEKTVGFYEGSQPQPWSTAAVPADFRDKLLNALMAFRIEIVRIEGKWKLNQNKSAAARAGVVRALRSSAREHEQDIARMMEQGLAEKV